MVAVNSVTVTITQIYVVSATAIRTPVIVSNVSSTLTVTLARCAKQGSMETLYGRIVKTVDVTSWALIRPRDRATIVPDNVRVCLMS